MKCWSHIQKDPRGQVLVPSLWTCCGLSSICSPFHPVTIGLLQYVRHLLKLCKVTEATLTQPKKNPITVHVDRCWLLLIEQPQQEDLLWMSMVVLHFSSRVVLHQGDLDVEVKCPQKMCLFKKQKKNERSMRSNTDRGQTSADYRQM